MISLLFLTVLACTSDGLECSAERACGFGQSCVNGTCEATVCATSDQCPMEHRCEDGACTAGCSGDNDCFPGDLCQADIAECRPAGCRSTELDCSFREFCDTNTGECYDAGEQYCRPCDHDEDCGEGNECWNHHCGGRQNVRRGESCNAWRKQVHYWPHCGGGICWVFNYGLFPGGVR